MSKVWGWGIFCQGKWHMMDVSLGGKTLSKATSRMGFFFLRAGKITVKKGKKAVEKSLFGK